MKNQAAKTEMKKTIEAATAITGSQSTDKLVAKVKASKSKPAKAAKPAKKASNGNPYRDGGLRFALFAAGAKGYESRKALAAQVAKAEKTSVVKAGFQLAVVCSASHPGNQKRSKEVEKNGKKFLVAC